MNRGEADKKALMEVAHGLLREGKVVRIEATGQSMFPAIKAGSMVHISPVASPDELQQGDIISWFRDDDMVLHRLVYRYSKEEENYFITRGDSSMQSDEPVTFGNVAGKVTLVEYRRRKFVPSGKLLPSWKYRLNRLRVLVRLKAHALWQTCLTAGGVG